MMTKGKSKNWAKSKLLLLIPVIGSLVLAFAHPRAVNPIDQAKQNNDLVTLAVDEGKKQTQSKEQEQKEKEKKLKEITHEEQMLIEKLAATDDPEVRKKIKMKLEEIQKLKENNGWVEAKNITMTEQQYIDAVKKLKTMFEKSEDPEEKAMLKQKLADLEEMKKEGRIKSETAIDYEKQVAELKALWEKTDDPEKKKEIEEKLKQLKQMMQKEKEKKKVK